MLIHRYTSRGLRRSVVAALGTLALAAPLAAQQPTQGAAAAAAPEGGQVITLEQAIEIALERNPTVQQAENSARLSALTVRQQNAELLPNLSATTSSQTGYGSAEDFLQEPSLSAGLSTSIQVPNLYSHVASLRQARLNVTGTESSLVRSQQTVVFNVMSQYLTLIEAQEQLGVQQQNLASAQAQEAQIQARVTAGDRSISDLYQQQAQTASARLAVVQAQRGLVVARMNLIRTLQLDPLGDYQFAVPELGPLTTSFSSLNLATMSEQALSQRPDLRASQIAVSSAEQGLRIASATRWPTLSLGLGYNTAFNSSNERAFFNQLDQERGGALQIGVSMPIFSPTYGITRQRAQIQLENARISLESTRQNVATEVRTAYLDLQLVEEQLTVAEAQVQAADLALQTAQQRYDVGAATLVELTQARVSQVRAASDLVNARYTLVFQARLIDYYLGNLTTSQPAN